MSAVDSIVCRQADLNDLAGLARLFDAYRQFYRQQPDISGAEAFLRTNLERQRAVIYLALEQKPQPDGSPSFLGFAQLYPTLSSVSMREVWTLNDLFVAAEARGRGIGGRLLSASAEHGRATGAAFIQLSTGTDNGTAQRLYEKSGYIRDTEFLTYSLKLENQPCVE
ncbi:GNAT family N-acetyltransferase [Paenibacillus filicis]|uniref:GNAT family N-acetyltransferase n=1 Tax=Paenibacillus filicis TaxID=669464 RepID=A0ABU9DFE3_9BACL